MLLFTSYHQAYQHLVSLGKLFIDIELFTLGLRSVLFILRMRVLVFR